MNDLATAKPSRSQNNSSNLPWGMFLFLLAIFFFSTPLIIFDQFWRPAITFDDAAGVTDVMRRDNWTRILSLVVLGAFSLFHLLRFKQSRLRINGLLGWLILFYLVWAVLSIVWSVDPRYTIKRVAILLFLCFGALHFADRFSLREIKALIVLICSVAILIGFFNVLRTQTFYPFAGWWRFGGNMHPISQAWHCGLLLLAALALAHTEKQNRAFYIGIAIIALLFLIMTRSRMAFIATFMGAAIYLALVETKWYRSVLIFLGIIIGGSLIYFFLGDKFFGFSETLLTLGRTGEVVTTKTLTGRVPLWKTVMGLIMQRPFMGYGYDSFLTGKNIIWIAGETGWATSSPHSAYLQIIGSLGFIGGVPFVLILILAVMISISLARRNSEYTFIVAVLVWLMLNMYTEDQVLTRPFFPVFAWMVLLAKLGFIQEES